VRIFLMRAGGVGDAIVKIAADGFPTAQIDAR